MRTLERGGGSQLWFVWQKRVVIMESNGNNASL